METMRACFRHGVSQWAVVRVTHTGSILADAIKLSNHEGYKGEQHVDRETGEATHSNNRCFVLWFEFGSAVRVKSDKSPLRD